MAPNPNAASLASTGAQDIYIQGMLNHQRRMANIPRSKLSEPPHAAFCGGTRRSPRVPVRSGSKEEEYTEVRETFKRILLAKPAVQNQMTRNQIEMGERLTRNRKLNKDQYQRMAHAQNLQAMHDRIARASSATERKKLNPALAGHPAMRMRKSLSTPPGELWRAAAAAKEFARLNGSPRQGTSERLMNGSPSRPRTAGAVVAAARPSSAARRKPVAGEAPPRPSSAGGGGGGVRAQRAQSVQRPQSAREPSRAGAADAGLGQPRNEEGALRELLLQRIVEARLCRETDLLTPTLTPTLTLTLALTGCASTARPTC